LNDALCKTSPHALFSNVWVSIEALHLADVAIDWSQRDATHRPVTVPSQQHTASWRRIFARQGDKFGLEILEAKVDTQTPGVLAEQ
jgi:hypothetical protein